MGLQAFTDNDSPDTLGNTLPSGNSAVAVSQPKFQPTPEQAKVVSHVLKGDSVAIRAFAGAGKTSTLKLVAETILKENPKRVITYFVFNSAMKNDATGRFPKEVRISTAHALAYNSTINGKPLGRTLKDRNRLRSGKELRDAVRDGFSSEIQNIQKFGPSEYQIISDILGSVRHFCYSADEKVLMSHVPKETSDILKVTQSPDISIEYRKEIKKIAEKVWKEQSTLLSDFPVDHDTYLKLWVLKGDFSKYDLVLFDEAQDANPVMIAALEKMKDHGAQIVLVGDTHQSIYGWRGAVDAMAKFPDFAQTYLTESFRFGKNIAQKAQLFLDAGGEKNQLIGRNQNDGIFRDGMMSEGDGPDSFAGDAILCRSNAGVIQETLNQIGSGNTPYVEGGAENAAKLLEALYSLYQTRGGREVRYRCNHPEISLFKNWEEMEEYSESKEGGEYKPFVNMTKRMAVDRTIEEAIHALKNNTAKSRNDADITISTVHKAKGLEWNRVLFGCDWEKAMLHVEREYMNEDGEIEKAYEVNRENYRLLYVAFTRAREAVDCVGNYDRWEQQFEVIKNNPVTPEIRKKAEELDRIKMGGFPDLEQLN